MLCYPLVMASGYIHGTARVCVVYLRRQQLQIPTRDGDRSTTRGTTG